jgi:preprotein translocase subunit YajC
MRLAAVGRARRTRRGSFGVFTPAFAQTVGGFGAGSDIFMQVAPFAAILVIMYFLLLRPQQRKAKAHQELVGNVRRGDIVVTTGGIIGKVTKTTDPAEVELEISPNVRVRLARPMISEVRAKGEPVKDAVPAAKS